MTDHRDTPTFNVKAVAQETGLKADTLRAWERRYGLPSPDRSEGGHRLYSQHDIDILKWLVARQDEGLSISNAVDLWNRLRDEGREPLTMPEYSTSGAGTVPAMVVKGETVVELRQHWVQACLEYDERLAEQILNQAFGLYPVETVVFEIIRAGIADIGQGWYQGNIVVQQEHFASELAVRRLEALVAATPPPSRKEKLMLACPPGELHSLGLLVLNLILRRRGWPVVFLGANVPLSRLESAVEAASPSLLISVAQQISTAASLRELGLYLKQVGIPLAYGGDIFNVLPELKQLIPGHFLGSLIREAPGVIENLVAHPNPGTEVDPIPASYQEALEHYQESLGLIENQVHEQFNGSGMSRQALDEINNYMAAGLTAAMKMGDLGLLNREIGWVEELIVNHMPEGRPLPDYLDSYYQAIKQQLGQDGRLILDWFESLQ